MREQGGCGHRFWGVGQPDTEVSLARSSRRKRTLNGKYCYLLALAVVIEVSK
jgi:hypothetical protein